MADQWYGISSWNIVDYCGYSDYYSLENALDGAGVWAHNLSHTHWFTLDLGDVWTVKELRGRSNAPYYDPYYVDVYVSDYDDFGNWILVASNINSWRDTTAWQIVNSSDIHGRYLLVEITETVWHPEWPYWNNLDWGIYYGPGSFDTMFDIYGCLYEVPIALSGQIAAETSVTGTVLGWSTALESTVECKCSVEGTLSGIVTPLGGWSISLSLAIGELTDQVHSFDCLCISEIEGGGDLKGAFELSGSVIGTSVTSGNLEFAAFVELNVEGILSSTTAVGTLTLVANRLYGQFGSQSTISGTLTGGAVLLAGSIHSHAYIAPVEILGFCIRIQGVVNSGSSLSGNLTGFLARLSSTITIQSTISGAIEVIHVGPYYKFLVSFFNCVSGFNGKLNRVLKSSSTLTVQSNIVSGLKVTRGLTGTLTTTSTVVSVLTKQVSIVSMLATQSAFNASLPVLRLLTTSIDAQSNLVGKLKLDLRGTITASSNITGNLKNLRELRTLIGATSSTSGCIVVTWKLSGLITPISTLGGALRIEYELVGTIGCSSTFAGNIIPWVNLTGTIASQSTVVCSFQLVISKRFVSLVLLARGTFNGNLKCGKSVTGEITAISTSTASLTVNVFMVGTVSSSTSLTGALRLFVDLQVIVGTTSTIIGSLILRSKLVAQINAQSTLAGTVCLWVPEFIISNVEVIPVFAATLTILSSLESDLTALPVFTYHVNVLPIFTDTLNELPVFTQRTRVNDVLKLVLT